MTASGPGTRFGLTMDLGKVREEWFSNAGQDLVAGLVVALALIPEAIAFSVIAGVGPEVGLYASMGIAVVIAFAGGRPGMISGATAAMALLMGNLVKAHGLPYLLAATVLTGLLQIAAGFLGAEKVLGLVPRAVTVGFVNALAILIFLAQLPELLNDGWKTFLATAAGVTIIYLVPRFTKAIPPSLVCLVLLSLFLAALGLKVRTVDHLGTLPSSLPAFSWPEVPWTFATLQIIALPAISLAAVGLLESLMTATVVDEATSSQSDKKRECRGQGWANITVGFFGGMAGCAMIGQTMVNLNSGGRGRLSTLAAGIFLLLLVLVGSPLLRHIPIVALVAVMITVSIGTFKWSSLTEFWTQPKASTITMVATVLVVVMTHNLAIGVLAGIVIHVACLSFSRIHQTWRIS